MRWQNDYLQDKQAEYAARKEKKDKKAKDKVGIISSRLDCGMRKRLFFFVFGI